MSEKYGFFARAWRNFAEALTTSQVASIVAAGALQLFALFLPLLNIVSNAVVALISFHYGNRRFVVIFLAAALTLAGAALLSFAGVFGGRLNNVFLLLGSYWLPILLITLFWERSSMTAVTQFVAVLALLGLGAAHLTVHDLTAMWQSLIYDFLPMERTDMPEEMITLIDTMAKNMTGMITAGLITLWMLCALFGRWMHLLLKARGLFRDEVANFRMGSILTALLVAAVVMWGLGAHPIWADIVYALSVLFVLQGIITAHQMIVILNKDPQSWLLGLYIALAVSMLIHPIIWLLMGVLGALENLVKFKHRCQLLKEGSSRSG